MLRPLRRSHSASHEDAFVQRYAQLLTWARRLTDGDRRAAEDLVHDAFVNFILSRPDLESVQNLDGYLFTSLRHLHLANMRRSRRRGDAHLPLVEYDSALDALKTVWAGRAHDELTTICHYACVRRRSSKAGSVLIFRFFHGYALAEIALVLRLPPPAIDTLLSVARREVREWMDHPRPLDALGRPDPSVPRILGFAQPDAFVAEVQRAIFESVYGTCRPAPEFEQLYDPAAPSLDADTLAHVVSCRPCLDRINRLLGLPTLSERHPDDGFGGGKRPPRGPSGGTPAGSGDSSPRNGERACEEIGARRARDVSTRRPTELRIAVNGIVVGGQQVRDSGVSQHLTVQTGERLGFVEVLDERDARLLLLSVDAAPDGAIDQSARVELSERRELGVTVSFANPWPIVTVTYTIPEAAHVRATADHPHWVVDSLLDPRHTRTPLAGVTATPNEPRASWWRRPFITLGAWPKPALVALTLLVVLALSIGPRDAVAAVMRAARGLVNTITTLISDADDPGDRREPLAVSAPRRTTDIALPALPKAVALTTVSAPASRGLSERARLRMKVQILERLDGVDALYGESLTLADKANGHLALGGVVQDAARQHEILDALGALRNAPHLDVKLQSASASSPNAPRTLIVHGMDVVSIPIHKLLKRHLELRGAAPGPELDETVRASSARIADLSRRAVLHTWAFKRVAAQVPEVSLSSVDEVTMQTWYALLQKHASAFGELSRQLRGELDAAGLAMIAEDAASSGVPPVSAALAAEALIRAGEDQDRTIRALFVAVSGETASDPEAFIPDLTHHLRVSRLVAQTTVQYCITRAQ